MRSSFNLLPHFNSLLRFFLVLICLVLLQLPFLAADADYDLGGSRGPFTDEGLYTAQARNATITGHLDLSEMDGVIKEPLFAAGMWLVNHCFGDSMLSCRSAIMIVAAFLIGLLAAGSSAFARTVLIAIPLGFLSFYIFHYGHLAMAEILCSLIILASCRLLYDLLAGFGGWRTLLMSSFLIFVAYACKIQFIYASLVPPLTFFLAMIIRIYSGVRPERCDWINLATSSLLACIFAVIYIIIWVAPHYELWASVMLAQTGERTAIATDIPKEVYYHLRKLIGDFHNWPIFLMLPFGLAGAWREWALSKTKWESREAWIALMAPLLAWLALESHKFFISYLPSRYLVSFYIALAMLVAAGLSMFKRSNLTEISLWFRLVGAIALTLSIFANAIFYQHAFRNRSYSIRDAQISLAAEGKWRGKVIMGGWAPALFWGTGAITLPVWKNYFNDRDIIARYNPSAIVSEINQEDSGGAFAADGIDLQTLTSRAVHVRKWEIHVYEIP